MIIPINYKILRLSNGEIEVILFAMSESSGKNFVVYHRRYKELDENSFIRMIGWLDEYMKINNQFKIPVKFGISEMQQLLESFDK